MGRPIFFWGSIALLIASLVFVPALRDCAREISYDRANARYPQELAAPPGGLMPTTLPATVPATTPTTTTSSSGNSRSR